MKTADMKTLERQYRTFLPSKSYAVIRVDGKGFSKYTKGLQRPFDPKFTADMQATALFLCENIEGAHFAYTQSDEISVIISDLAGSNTQAWFGGQVHNEPVRILSGIQTETGDLFAYSTATLWRARVSLTSMAV